MEEQVNIPALGIVCCSMRISKARAYSGNVRLARERPILRKRSIHVGEVPRKVL